MIILVGPIRNQRVRLYTYEDISSGVWTRSRWRAYADVWGRVDEPSGAEAMVGGETEHRIRAVVSLDLTQALPQKSLVRDDVTGALYKVQAVLRRPQLQNIQAMCVGLGADETLELFDVGALLWTPTAPALAVGATLGVTVSVGDVRTIDPPAGAPVGLGTLTLVSSAPSTVTVTGASFVATSGAPTVGSATLHGIAAGTAQLQVLNNGVLLGSVAVTVSGP